MPRHLVTAALLLAAPISLSAQASDQPFRFRSAMASGTQARVHSVNGSVRVIRGGSEFEVVATRTVRRGDPDFVKFEARTLRNGDVLVCALWGPEQECTDDGVRGRVNLRSNSPDVSVEMIVRVPAGVRVLARTVNGGLDVRGMTATVDAATVNGGVFVETSTGPVDISTVNGSVEARMASVPGDGGMKLTTVNGDVTVSVPETLSANLEARTTNGQIQSDIPVTVRGTRSLRRLEGTLQGGGRLVRLSTVNGSVRVRRAST
jgi:DUF4097 and DUF4098 domain-containing protein YvlB